MTAGRIDAVIERLHSLYPKLIDLSLGRLERVLAALGDPHLHLPPVLHVAGTNGKGSTCAFLRAMGEAGGLRVHVATSPHLVRFNERIRLAGTLVTDEALAEALGEVERVNAAQPITVFEVLMAASFLLFRQVPADLVVLEVGLGGRFDATNVIKTAAACAITSISMDHKDFLGDTLAKIAFEKAGIMKPDVPVITGAQPEEVLAVFDRQARAVGAHWIARGREWRIAGGRYSDALGSVDLPPPALPGAHQYDNAGIAVATMRTVGLVPDSAIAAGVGAAVWPARMQRLHGALTENLPAGWELWLDGGHNPGGGLAIATHLATWRDRPTHVIVGMKKAKDTAEFLRPIIPHAATLWAIAEPGQHLALPVDEIIAASGGVARPGPTLAEAMAQLPPEPPARILVCGSLYLAGEVLKADFTLPV